MTVAFVGGMASGTTPGMAMALPLAALAFLVASLVCRGGRRLVATGALLTGYFFLGTSAQQLARQSVQRQPLLRLYQSLGERGFEGPCLLNGVLRAEPTFNPQTVELQLSVEELRLRGTRRAAAGNLNLHVRGDPELRRSLTDLEAGDRVSVWATLYRPRGFLNPGGFQVEAYLARTGVSMSGSTKSSLLVERQASAGRWSLARKGSQARGFVRHRIREAFDSMDGGEVPGVLIALLIGDRSLIPPWAEKLHQESGIFHVIVISGAHVALLAWLVYGALRWSGFNRTPALVALLITLPLYAALCGGGPSVVRAATMGAGVVGARLLSLDVSAVNGLAVSALLLLAFRPLDLEDPGFQLSFAATLAIVVVAEPLARRLTVRLGRLGHLFAISLAAQAAVVPILAWHFQRLTLGSVAASVLAIPLAAGSLGAGALLLILSPVPWLGGALAWLAWVQVKALTVCSQFVVGVPGASLRVPQPGRGWLCLYFGLLAMLFLSRLRVRRCAAVLLCLATLWLPFGWAPSASPGLRLMALDVGHGDCLLLTLPDGRRILVDGGGSFDRSFDVGERVVVPALLRLGIRSLHAVVLTHSDFDHLGGLAAVVSNLDVEEIWEGRPDWALPDYRDLMEKARDRGVRVRRLRAGEEIHFDGVEMQVLSAGTDSLRNGNNDSVVLRVCYGRACILLTGDAERELEQALIRSGRRLRADVLKVGHHGSRTSTSSAFLEAVRPHLAVISTGAGNPYLPSARVVNRLRARGVTCFRTDLDGAVSIGLDRWGGIQMETFRNRP